MNLFCGVFRGDREKTGGHGLYMEVGRKPWSVPGFPDFLARAEGYVVPEQPVFFELVFKALGEAFLPAGHA